MTREMLDTFGEILMRRVRDEAIVDWDMILEGRMKDAASQKIAHAMEALTPEQRLIIFQIVPQVIDTTLHHLLWALEQEHGIEIHVQTESGESRNIVDESDGLAGDLYDWLPRFSKQRYQNPADPQ